LPFNHSKKKKKKKTLVALQLQSQQKKETMVACPSITAKKINPSCPFKVPFHKRK